MTTVFLVVGTFLVSILLGIPFALLTGWFLMLAIGVIHAQVLPAVIPAGYFVCVILAALLNSAFGTRSTSTSSK